MDAHHMALASADARIREQVNSLHELHLAIDGLRNEAGATAERVLADSHVAGAREAEFRR